MPCEKRGSPLLYCDHDLRYLLQLFASAPALRANEQAQSYSIPGISPPTMPSYLLALNCGSSSLKSTLYSYPGLEQVASVSASSIGSDSASLKTKYTRPRRGSLEPKNLKGESHAEIFQDILRTIENELPEEVFRGSKEDIKVVTHRIVHGGTFDEPVVVTKDHTEALKKMDEVGCRAF